MYRTEAGSWVKLRSSSKGTFILQRGRRVYVACPVVPDECWELVLQHVGHRELAALHATAKLFKNAVNVQQRAILARYAPLSASFDVLRAIEAEVSERVQAFVQLAMHTCRFRTSCLLQTGARSWDDIAGYDVRLKAAIGGIVLKAAAANCDQQFSIRNWRLSLEDDGGHVRRKNKGSAWSDQPWLHMFLRALRTTWGAGGCAGGRVVLWWRWGRSLMIWLLCEQAFLTSMTTPG